MKTTGVGLKLLTGIDILLIIEKGTRVEFAKQHIGMLKQIINIWKIAIKTYTHI